MVHTGSVAKTGKADGGTEEKPSKRGPEWLGFHVCALSCFFPGPSFVFVHWLVEPCVGRDSFRYGEWMGNYEKFWSDVRMSDPLPHPHPL